MPTKSKKPSVEIKPEFELPAQGSEPPRKKKKKNAPDKPQPEWMFPPDEENPVINPKPKSEAHISKDEKERDQAIRFLQYTSVTAPMKAPPPDLLLSLVGAFLSSYGFHHTSRLYTTQLQSRKKLDAWKIELGAKLPKGFPDLVKIFKEWYKGYQEKLQVEETSSSDSDDSDDAKAVKKSKKAKKAKKEVKAEAKASEAAAAKVIAKDITSSSGSGSSDEDVEMKDATPAQKPTKKSSELSKIKSSSISTSHSSSDSDADDEKENAGAQLVLHTASPKPTVNGLVNSLKRKASPGISSSSESESDSDTSSSAGLQAVSGKKDASSSIFNVIPQPQNSVPISEPSAESSSSSDTSSSDSGSAAKPAKPAKPAAATTAIAKAESGPSSDSSSSDSEFDNGAPKSTLTTTTTTKAEASSSSSSSESISSDGESSEVDFSKPPKPTVTKTTKVVTAKPTQVSSDSSVTLQASSAQKPSAANTSLSSTSSSDSLTSADQQAVTTVTTTTTSTKRKRSSSPTPKASKFTKKQNTPFQRVPQDTPVDPKMASNAYRSYDYADRAHQDLSVTKGKGFTKEKNKKKRGSYRGGAIDVSGGKGVKFVD
ncbi:hypothetical protein HO133_002398 [Letharia lupina]|uniref:Srp40 C-terminal domain-containing protein n=1 Tax=Letharia lupina TaxID=560253 RepID=A0A8H6FAQ2_9LECA|nr:uncharacterized protein HO133_002398 [Letharia lupina]KAF6221542.1 hypothetical protein HO133_002398 [Letharia lupina]